MPQRVEAPARLDTQPAQGDMRFVQSADLLPVQLAEQNIKNLLEENSRVLIVGQTGSGKTTWVPRFMLDVAKSRNPNARIIVTQPKRLAVDNVANTVRKALGQEVGYRYKNVNTITEDTKIAFMVDGSLVNELKRNPTLDGWDAVMVDEVHEETEDMLYELAMLKKAQELRKQQGKPPLTLVVASGTVDVEKIKGYLPGVGVEEVEGRQHPIDDHYSDYEIDPEDIVSQAAKTVEKILSQTTDGDILVFMPGRSHIAATIAEAKALSPHRNNVSFSAITGGDQDKTQYVNINEKAPDGQRRIFVATDAAQTSITIKGITNVVMSGLKKEGVYDAATGLFSLRLTETTKTDLEQQRGRAGRETAGRAWFLMKKDQYDARPEFPGSEIGRVDLTRLVLRIVEREEDPYTFDFMTKPPKERIDAALETLKRLGAIDKSGKITDDIGRQMTEIPTDPHFARMLVEAKKRGCVEAVSVLIGFLNSGRSVFAYNPRTEEFNKKYAQYINPESDYLTLLNVWNAYVNTPMEQTRAFLQEQGFSGRVFYEARTAKNDLISEEIFEDLGLDRRNKVIDLSNAELVLAIKQSITAGLTDRLLKQGQNNTYDLVSGRRKGILIDRSSVLAQNPVALFASGAIRALENGRAYAGLNQKVTQELLDEVAPYLAEIQVSGAVEQEGETIAETTSVREAKTQATQEAAPTASQTPPAEHSVPQAPAPKGFLFRLKAAATNMYKAVKSFFTKIGKSVQKLLRNIQNVFWRR